MATFPSTKQGKFAVAQALQAHPDRVSILQTRLTVREARTIARAAAGGKKPPKSRNDAGWLRGSIAFAQKAHSEYGHPKVIDADILRDVLKDPAQADFIWRRAGQAFISMADRVKDTLASHPVPPKPMFDDATPEEVTLDEATLEPAE